MFYADFVLSKKGPLARIWLAAHWDKKLTKAQIFETNIESSIERILKPKVKLALRTSGHLMLGVVRIYSRKTKYLLADCNEAFVKIKMAFRPGVVDLPENPTEAAVNAVTFPEVFHDFDCAMSDLNDVDIEAQFTLNQSRADEITMREDYSSAPLHTEDGFGLVFDASNSDLLRNSVGFDQSLQQPNLFNEGIDGIDRHKMRPSTSEVNSALEHIPMDDVLSKDVGEGGGFFNASIFEDPIIAVPTVENNSLQTHEAMDTEPVLPSTSKQLSSVSPAAHAESAVQPRLNDDDDFDDDHFIPPSPIGGSSDGSRPPSPISAPLPGLDIPVNDRAINEGFVENENIEQPNQQIGENVLQEGNIVAQNGEVQQNIDHTALLQNEEESFALAPVDASALKGLTKTKRKRKLIVDEVKNISGEEMKAQLSDTSDIVITLDLAPPTKRLMHWKETGGVEKLFALPGKNIPSTALFKNYQRHLISRAAPNDEGFEEHTDATANINSEAVELNPVSVQPTPGKRGRKRKLPRIEEENIDDIELAPPAPPAPPSMNLVEDLPIVATPNQNIQAAASPVQTIQPPSTPIPASQSPNIPALVQSPAISVQPVQSPTVPAQTVQSPVMRSPENQTFAAPNSPIQAPIIQAPVSPIMNQNEVVMQDSITSNINGFELDSTSSNLIPEIQNPLTPGINAEFNTELDYENPPSVGPIMEERGIDETVEQFEERLLNKRAGHLYSAVRMRIMSDITTTFSDLIVGNPRKQIAQKFYSLLVLKKHRVLELTQDEPYGMIFLTRGSNFDDPKL